MAIVINTQPQPGMWTSGLYQICGAGQELEWEICVKGWLCDFLLYADIVAGLSGSSSCDCAACCCYCCCRAFSCVCFHNVQRQKLRAAFNLQPEPCGDCPVTWLCSRCALCQEMRELKARTNGTGVLHLNQSPTVVIMQGGPQVMAPMQQYPPQQQQGYPPQQQQGYPPQQQQQYAPQGQQPMTR